MKSLPMTVPFTLALLVGCGSTSTNAPTDGGADVAADAPAQSPLGFTPSNIDLSGMDLSKVGDVIITGANCGIIDPEGLTINCTDNGAVAAKTITFADQSKMAVFVMKSLRVEASALMEVRGGHIPVALVALDTMTFVGSLKVDSGTGGGAFNTQNDVKGSGPGGGNGGPGSNKAAGTGASYCGQGGVGTTESGGTAYAKVAGYGTPDLVPLLGGSAGGGGALGGSSAQGGGAIQLVAGKSIDLKAGAFISAPGAGGGQGGLAGSQESTGGGSGGALLLEAPTVTIAGVLAVNGGGAGEGAGGNAGGGKNGDNGHDSDALAAAGGAAGTGNHGGNGGAGDQADGTDGTSDGTASASGGGGGAGRIRINTSSGAASVGSATLSPSAKTACMSQGKLKP